MIPFPEYPRPQLERKKDWLILNGKWNLKVLSEKGDTVKEGSITVPFSPEAPLSGFGHQTLPEETLVYSRQVSLPFPFDKDKEKLILHFGAVDYEARILIDGEEKKTHKGGYLPFSLEVEKSEFLLTVEVKDPTDNGDQERGKQKTKRGGIWYTPQSGIWQTVWIEKVPSVYITGLKLIPDTTGFSITVSCQEDEEATLSFNGEKYTLKANEEKRIQVSSPHLWSPEDPYLYHFSLLLGNDEVFSYLGLRSFGVGEDGNGIKRLMLNGKSYFHHALLDQGYWMDGLYTPPSDEAMVEDIRIAKDMGFNCLRKHIKIESPRWYYHCDRLGMLVWQDAVSGGGKYNPLIITAPLILGSHLKDNHYSLLGRRNEEKRKEFENNLFSMIDTLFNTVSIAMWVVFNEAWGQFDSVRIGKEVERKDPTRTVDYHSGWLDQGEGSFRSLHVYFRPYVFHKDKKNRCVILSEFGGYGHKVQGHTWGDDTFEYKGFKNREELTDAVVDLYEKQIIPAVSKGLSASVYTQLSDVEDELNGLVTYDRKVVKMDKEKIRAMSDKLLGK